MVKRERAQILSIKLQRMEERELYPTMGRREDNSLKREGNG